MREGGGGRGGGEEESVGKEYVCRRRRGICEEGRGKEESVGEGIGVKEKERSL